MKFQGNTALITGASSGIGKAFAYRLAAREMDLLLTALPEEHDLLRMLAEELVDRHGVRVEVVTDNLAERGAAQRLQAMADDLHFEPDMLVNSAGIGNFGAFSEAPLDRQLAMLYVNVEALVALTGLYLPRLVARRNGAVINIVSGSAFRPWPYLAVYAASKAFVLRFSEALWAENHRHGVRVVAVCPGPVATRFYENAGIDAPDSGSQRLPSHRILTADMVVASAIDALDYDRPTVVRRLPEAALTYVFVALAEAVVPRKLRLLATERLVRWYSRAK